MWKNLTLFNLVGFTIHLSMAILRRGLPSIGNYRRSARDEKVRDQLEAEMEYFHGGLRLSTLFNEKPFAYLRVKPEFVLDCLKTGSPDEHGIKRFEIRPLRQYVCCLLYTSPSPRDLSTSRMPSSA